ncbi:putative ABC transporter permease subunit [Halobacillus massiliensis]|uniref:putative ABC transporter permease subunit n=1 Tax=Halobacillus massiliensis TaxID=1926286 RepID=UPI0009E3FA38|nr:ABC transporter permease [Halobacillus massiliensis]
MNKTFRLIQLMLKMQFSLSGKSTMEIGSYVLLLVFAFPFSAVLFYSLDSIIGALYETLAPTGNETFILSLLFILMFVLFIFLSISSILSSFYFAEDIESFIPLPFQPYQLMAAKSAAPLVTLYIANLIILAPALVIFNLYHNSGFLYYIYAFAAWLSAPVLPFVLTAIVIMFVMRFLNIAKNKDRMKIIAGLLMFVFIIGINVLLRLNLSADETGESMAQLIHEKNGLLQAADVLFPTAYFNSAGLGSPNSISAIGYIFLSLAITAAAFGVFLTAGQRLYFKGVLGLSGSSKKSFNNESIRKQVKQRPVLWVSWLREMRVIFRTPAYFTQIIVQSLLLPVLFVVIFFFDRGTSLGTMSEQADEKNLILMITGFTVFILGISPASISSISRDGKNWFNHLYMPISARTLITSKLLAAFVIHLLSLIIVGVVGWFFMDLPLAIIFIWMVLSLFINWITAVIGTATDLYIPRLNWTDEREVFKGRLTGFLSFFIEAALLGPIFLIIWRIDAIQGRLDTSLALLAALITITVFSQVILDFLTKKYFYRLLDRE